MALLLGVDLGTTAIKAGLYEESGTLVASGAAECELTMPVPSQVELDVDLYWQRFVDAVRAVSGRIHPHDVAGLAISAQGETLVGVGIDGRPVRPAISWLDNRANKEAEQLREKFGETPLFEVTGQTEMLPTWPAPKVMWIREHEPEVYRRAAKWLLLEDYFILRMTGEAVCEDSLITSTCYWNFRTRTWWPEMLDCIGLDTICLPRIEPSGVAVGTVRTDVAAELGLASQTVVATGALDQACGAVGVGNVRSGIFSENTGAALALCATLDEPVLDDRRRVPCHAHAIPGRFMLHTFTSGGILLRWWRDRFARVGDGDGGDVDPYERMIAEAERVPPGSEGVLAIPHLQGAMAPDPNPDARAGLVGLGLSHGPGHVVRALMESIAYLVRRNVEAMTDMGLRIEEIRALGGGARSPLWKQIEASVTGLPVVVTACEEPATLGAAMLAAVATGIFPSVESAAADTVGVHARFEPDERVVARYDECYARYCAVSERVGSLDSEFAESTGAS